MDVEPDGSRGSKMDELLRRMSQHRNWVEPLVGRTCTRVTIDGWSPPLVLSFLDDVPAARVEINVPFRLAVGPDRWTLDPVDGRTALAPTLRLIGQSVTRAVTDPEGGLRVEFADGAVLDVDPSNAISEPWWFDMDA